MRRPKVDLAIATMTYKAVLRGDQETVDHMAHIATYIADLEGELEDNNLDLPALPPISIWPRPRRASLYIN